MFRTSGPLKGLVVAYSIDPNNYAVSGPRYNVRPFAYVQVEVIGSSPATAQAILNDDGQVVRVVHGPVPLWGARRGEDVMMTEVLGFDLRVYDPGAPMFATLRNFHVRRLKWVELDVVLTPSDPGWLDAYMTTTT